MEWTVPGYHPIAPLRRRAAGAVTAGDIWTASRARDDAVVAVKLFPVGSGESGDSAGLADLADPMDPADPAGRAEREAEICRAVAHPHVLAVQEVVHGSDLIALVMPAMDGGSLADLLAARGRLPWPEALTVLTPLADALAAAHERGYVHGDISPGNILFDRAGRPVLADFGAARAAAETGTPVAVTPMHVAPEIVRGALPDARSDLFSVGSVALCCLTGRPAWPADDLDDVLVQSVAGQWPDLEDHMAPPALCAVVRRLLAAEPADRGSAAALAVHLRDVGRPSPVLLAPVGGDPAAVPATVVRPDAIRPPGRRVPARTDRLPRWWRRRRHAAGAVSGEVSGPAFGPVLGAVAAGALVIAAAAAAGWWWSSAGQSRPMLAAPSVAAADETGGSMMNETVAVAADSTGAVAAATAHEAAPPIGDPDWLAVVAALDRARSAAFVALDPSLLSQVYTADSSARSDDERRIAALRDAGYHPSGAAHDLRSVVVREITGDQLVLDVTAALPASVIRDDDGTPIGRTPMSPLGTSRMVLAKGDDGFRIMEIGVTG